MQKKINSTFSYKANQIKTVLLLLTVTAFLNAFSTSSLTFDQGMICRIKDAKKYKNAYANDKALFDFAKKNYIDYLKQSNYLSTERIPKIIHQIWIGPNLPPEEFLTWRQSWLDLHPDWQYHLWTDREVEQLVLVNKEFYDEETNYGAKADILRLEILYQFGGLYIDIDCECLQSFDMLHHSCDFYTGFFQVSHLNGKGRLNNAIIGARQQHPLIKKLMEEIKNNRIFETEKHRDILKRTGPDFFSKVIHEHIIDMEGINILLPSNYFYSWTKQKNQRLKLITQPETMAIHYFAGTWFPHKKRFRPTKKCRKQTV